MAQRALVLGGGGITGVAWEWGMLAGLAANGVDLSNADLVVGTSAGSVVGVQVAAGLDVDECYRAQLAPPEGEVKAAFSVVLAVRYGWALVGSRTPRRARTRIGRLALRARTVSESARLRVIDGVVPVREWPERSLMITAVDAETGEFRIFDRMAAVPLIQAVAASCAVPGVWPPVTIDGRRYLDGGARSATNADLAAGYDRVVVLAPLPRGLGPITGVDTQVDALRARSRVALVAPNRAALRAFGRNVLDPAKRAAAARAGWAQAACAVDQVRSVWSG